MDKILFANSEAGKPRRVTVNEVEYLVVPVVAIKPGVLNGHLATEEEFAANVSAWEGIPVPVEHPKVNGTPVTINAKGYGFEKTVIGDFRNVEWDGRMKGEIWINIATATANGFSDVVTRAEQGEPMNVSTGFTAKSLGAPGNLNGKAYKYVWANHNPDHLAILPNKDGACSLGDGCGLNVNEEKKGMRGFLQRLLAAVRSEGLNVLELSNNDTERAIYAALEREDPSRYYFIRDVFPESLFFVYASEPKEGPAMGRRMLRRGYSVTEADQIVLGTETTEVIEKTEYVDLSINSKEDPDMDRKQRVEALINNAKAPWGEGQREFLTGLPEAQFVALEKATCGCTETPTQVQANEQGISLDDVKRVVQEALQANEEQRTAGEKDQLIQRIQANGSKLPESTLRKLEVNELKEIESAIKPASYGGRGFPRTVTANEEEGNMPLPNRLGKKEGDE